MREFRTEELARERAQIVKSGRLHWFHWAIVLLSLAVTGGAWYFSKSQIEQRTAEQFTRYSSQFVEIVDERLEKYEEGLWGGVAAIQAAGGDVSYEEWKAFAKGLRIDLRYPGINGIGVIHFVEQGRLESYLTEQRLARPDYAIHPAHDKPHYLPITYIEPVETNARAVGLDMAHETNRYQAALRARDTGVAQITGPIVLVQDEDKTPGFLFYAPYYADVAPETEAERQARFQGMVYAPFVFHKLIEGTLETDKRQVRVTIRDGADVLYDEAANPDPDFDPDPMYRTEIALDLYGRTWTFDIATTKSFRASHASGQPLLILAGGIFIDTMLLTLFILISRANRRAISFVDAATSELERRADALEQSNAELESFAYVASHDLKAPLRGISNLASWIEEDIGDSANEDVRGHTRLLHGRVGRMENLLDDLLQYSRAGRDGAQPETVDIEASLPDIFKLLEPPDGVRLEIECDLPPIATARAPLEQVMRNLIGNALKHRDDQTSVVSVKCRDAGDMYEISVIDDGPGIPPAYHEKVFQIFQTLKSRDELEASGIGLAIIKRIVTSAGGVITLTSDPERTRGATFTFTWPKQWRGHADGALAA